MNLSDGIYLVITLLSDIQHQDMTLEIADQQDIAALKDVNNITEKKTWGRRVSLDWFR